MMSGKKYLIKYSGLSTFGYIQLNGEGEKLTGAGEIEIRRGEFLRCSHYSNNNGFIEKDGVIVASNYMGGAEYDFYPESDAEITYATSETDPAVYISHIIITTK